MKNQKQTCFFCNSIHKDYPNLPDNFCNAVQKCYWDATNIYLKKHPIASEPEVKVEK